MQYKFSYYCVNFKCKLLIYYYLQPALELNKCSTWDEKLELLTSHISEKIDTLSIENQKFLCTTIYDHVIAIQDYNISSLPRLKSSIILLKPTFTSVTFIEEDYGLHKVNMIGA